MFTNDKKNSGTPPEKDRTNIRRLTNFMNGKRKYKPNDVQHPEQLQEIDQITSLEVDRVLLALETILLEEYDSLLKHPHAIAKDFRAELGDRIIHDELREDRCQTHQ